MQHRVVIFVEEFSATEVQKVASAGVGVKSLLEGALDQKFALE
jgi:hypothetical protein